MKKTGIVICNYNKKEFVINCIQSVLESKIKDFDVFVVDNASTDGSAEAILERYGEQVTLLINEENLGGSGGFNTGIRKVLEVGYEYLYCLDNDVLVDENAIGSLVEYLDKHPDTGVAGSIVYHMDYPDYVQQYGLDLKFDTCNAVTHYADFLDDGTIPQVKECDTVATCSVMIRTSCIRKSDIGIMPEDNFIYWDDMEWIYRFTLAGYRVVTVKASAVLHKMGANVKPVNTFTQYYMWRNRLNFFMKYTPESELERMSVQILCNVFDAIYESMYKEEHHKAQTISYAFYDSIRGVRGKAAPHKIMESDQPDDKLAASLQGKKTYYVEESMDNDGEKNIKSYLQEIMPEMEQRLKRQEAEVVFVFCNDVLNVMNPRKDVIYIDQEYNCILDDEDRQAVEKYAYNRSLFLYMNQGAFLDAAHELRVK